MLVSTIDLKDKTKNSRKNGEPTMRTNEVGCTPKLFRQTLESANIEPKKSTPSESEFVFPKSMNPFANLD